MENILNWNIPIEKYFEQVARIPRESGHEEAISQYLLDFAEERGLWSYRDDSLNVIIRKPASAGYEDAAPLMLEAHTDMVCAKTPDCVHDFRKDPIEFYVKDGIMRAKGTSLGADDGWGVAYMLAILEDDTLKHPMLECVFTTCEETNMGGAKALDVSKLRARRMIGLDGDVDTESFVSCFTSDRLVFRKKVAQTGCSGNAVRIAIGDMSTNVYGGINHPECGNSIKIVARLLKNLVDDGVPVRIAGITGGRAENIVPETGEVILNIGEYDATQLEKKVRAYHTQLNDEFEKEDFHGRMTVENTSAQAAMTEEDSKNLTEFLYLLPNNMLQAGIESHSLNCINNIGMLRYVNGEVTITVSGRSRYISAGDDLLTRCRTLAELFGYEFETEKRYQGWPYNKTSQIRTLVNEAMREQYGCELKEVICPGGLEIAILVEAIEGMDAIELGVNHDNPHSTEESMEMVSFHKMYQVVTAVLEKCVK